jgi:phospho-N-acetylmuramoyl-pentapeptide-transferase
MRVFEYEIFRAAVATLTAMLISLVIGPMFIERLKQFQISQYVRKEGPQSHQKKQGTPTMGGLLILGQLFVGWI